MARPFLRDVDESDVVVVIFSHRFTFTLPPCASKVACLPPFAGLFLGITFSSLLFLLSPSPSSTLSSLPLLALPPAVHNAIRLIFCYLSTLILVPKNLLPAPILHPLVISIHPYRICLVQLINTHLPSLIEIEHGPRIYVPSFHVPPPRYHLL